MHSQGAIRMKNFVTHLSNPKLVPFIIKKTKQLFTRDSQSKHSSLKYRAVINNLKQLFNHNSYPYRYWPFLRYAEG